MPDIFPSAPGESIPEIPVDIDGYTDAKLMQLYGQFGQWCNYYDQLLVEARETEDKTLFLKDSAEASAMLANENKKNVSLIKAAALDDPTYAIAYASYVEARSYRRKFETLLKMAERGYSHCSRELSRRTQPKRPEKTREYGWGKNGTGHLND